MAAAADLVIYSDSGETLEPHTYSPRSVNPQSVTLVNAEGNSSAGNRTLVAGFDQAKANRKTDRVTFRFEFPIERQVGDPAYSQYEVKDVARAKVEFILPDSMTSAEREDFYHLVHNGQGLTALKEYVTLLSPIW